GPGAHHRGHDHRQERPVEPLPRIADGAEAPAHVPQREPEGQRQPDPVGVHLDRTDVEDHRDRSQGADPRVGRVPERFVSCERGDDGVARLRLDRPKMNALSITLLGQLAEEVAALQADPPGAVVVWGGPRIFAAGADVSEFVDPSTGMPSPARAAAVGSAFRSALDGLAALPVPTIAAVNGYALGGG